MVLESQNRPETRRSLNRCYHLTIPNRIQITFGRHAAWWSNAGHRSFRSRWPSTCGLASELVDHHCWTLGHDARGGRTRALKMLTDWWRRRWRAATCIDVKPTCCAPMGFSSQDPGLRSQGAVHPGDVPAQLPVKTNVRQLDRVSQRAAGHGPGRIWGRTRRRAIHHRPGFDHLRRYITWSVPRRGRATKRLHGVKRGLLATQNVGRGKLAPATC